jgi:hypothetical protein
MFDLRKLGAAALALSVLAVVAVGLGSRTVAAQQTGSGAGRTITVSGFGEVFGAPDTAYINLGVDRTDADVTAAVDGARQTLSTIVNTLINEAGIAENDIQTSNFFVYAEDRFDPQTGRPTGERIYRAQLGISVTVRDIDSASNVISIALNAGANSLNGLNFGIADTGALEAEARQQAVVDARERAQQLAEAFGVTLGEVVSIAEGVQLPVPMPLGNARLADSAGGLGGSNINPGQLGVDVQLAVTFAISG